MKITTNYDDVEALCPYYKGSNAKQISCEGITEGSITILSFSSKEKRNKQRRIFCNQRYENCEVFRMLEEKYED